MRLEQLQAFLAIRKRAAFNKQHENVASQSTISRQIQSLDRLRVAAVGRLRRLALGGELLPVSRKICHEWRNATEN